VIEGAEKREGDWSRDWIGFVAVERDSATTSRGQCESSKDTGVEQSTLRLLIELIDGIDQLSVMRVTHCA